MSLLDLQVWTFPGFTSSTSHNLTESSSAYTANTLVALGMQAPKVLPPNFLGIGSFPVGDVWKAIGVPSGIFLWLLAFWFCALSTVSVLSSWREMHFTLNWWAFIFPNAGLTIALIQIANVLDSDGIKAVCSGMTTVLLVLWFFVAAMNLRAVLRREVLWPGMDEDMEDMEETGEGEEDETTTGA